MLRILLVLLLIPSLSFAQNEENTVLDTKEPLSKTYAPDFCEFSVTFPSEPYKSRKCEDKGAKSGCYDLVSYTQVYDMASTVNFRIICNPIGDEVLKAYSPEVMQATLRAMTKNSVVQEFNTSFREEDHYKQAGLVGEGLTGRTPTIYIAQLWIGEKSALSVEAELIGEPMEGADSLFRDVLASVGHKDDVAAVKDAEGEDETAEDGSAEEDETPEE